jgi:hypothetical protein
MEDAAAVVEQGIQPLQMFLYQRLGLEDISTYRGSGDKVRSGTFQLLLFGFSGFCFYLVSKTFI